MTHYTKLNTMNRVLFVSSSKRHTSFYYDPSARYRCVFPAEHLKTLGIDAAVVHFSQLGELDIKKYPYIIFHRPRDNSQLRKFLKQAERVGCTCIADFDDLLFAPELAHESPAVRSGGMSRSESTRQAKKYLSALRLFRTCWLSTDELRLKAKLAAPDTCCYTVYNRMPARWAALHRKQDIEKRLADKVIRYLPGTSHHIHDLSEIRNTLTEILERFPEVRIEIIGDLKVSQLGIANERLTNQPYMDYEKLPSFIADSWLTLAPLAANDFNRCKSALKFWESGIAGVPVLFSPLPDAERFDNSGLTICRVHNDWITRIAELHDPDVYQCAVEQAYDDARNALFDAENDQRLSYLPGLTLAPVAFAPERAFYRSQQDIMTARFGSIWPGRAVNPLDTEYSRINNSLYDSPEQHQYTLSSPHYIQLDSRPARPFRFRVRRKYRKLMRSPKAFFRDALQNHFSGWRRNSL